MKKVGHATADRSTVLYWRVERQKGVNAVKRCPVENQKGTITIGIV